MKNDLQQDVAKFLLELVGFARVERVESFVAFFNEIVADGLVGLLAVPRAAVRAAQPRHDPQQPRDVLGLRCAHGLCKIRGRGSYGKENWGCAFRLWRDGRQRNP